LKADDRVVTAIVTSAQAATTNPLMATGTRGSQGAR
jgi:hypothetical protein